MVENQNVSKRTVNLMTYYTQSRCERLRPEKKFYFTIIQGNPSFLSRANNPHIFFKIFIFYAISHANEYGFEDIESL